MVNARGIVPLIANALGSRMLCSPAGIKNWPMILLIVVMIPIRIIFKVFFKSSPFAIESFMFLSPLIFSPGR
jgi:hypothetical protein